MREKALIDTGFVIALVNRPSSDQVAWLGLKKKSERTAPVRKSKKLSEKES